MRDVLAHALASETKLDVVQTEARGHATSLARQAAVDGLDVVVALGGDGTVNEVVNGLLADGPVPGLPALAVVPGGSANVFARALGLPDTAVEATGQLLDALREGRRRTVGLGQADDRWFTFCAGLGLDAEVVRRVEHQRADGRQGHPRRCSSGQGLQHFFLGAHRQEPAITVHAGDARARAHRPRAGLQHQPLDLPRRRGRCVPCPDASFETGPGPVRHAQPAAPSTTLRHLRQILSRDPRPRGRAVLQPARRRRASCSRADRPLALQVDGDDLGDRTEVVFRAVPRRARRRRLTTPRRRSG